MNAVGSPRLRGWQGHFGMRVVAGFSARWEFVMNIRVVTAATVILMVLSVPLFAQENSPLDLSGTWRWIHYEDLRERAPGAYPGDYMGVPLNDAARMRADTYDEEWNSTSLLNQCRLRGPNYQPKALDYMQFDKEFDPITRKLVAYRVSYWKTLGERIICLDGR